MSDLSRQVTFYRNNMLTLCYSHERWIVPWNFVDLNFLSISENSKTIPQSGDDWTEVNFCFLFFLMSIPICCSLMRVFAKKLKYLMWSVKWIMAHYVYCSVGGNQVYIICFLGKLFSSLFVLARNRVQFLSFSLRSSLSNHNISWLYWKYNRMFIKH